MASNSKKGSKEQSEDGQVIKQEFSDESKEQKMREELGNHSDLDIYWDLLGNYGESK